MFLSVRSILSAISLVGGAVTTVLGLVSLLGRSWDDFLFRMGLAYLVLVGLTLLILAARSAAPAHENAGEQLRQATNGTEDLGLCVGVLLGATAFYTAIAALGLVLGSLSFREWIGAIGASAVMVFAIGIPALWSELVPALRAMTRPRRPCPRCGLSVPAGEMKCPHCEFDFWKVGA